MAAGKTGVRLAYSENDNKAMIRFLLEQGLDAIDKLAMANKTWREAAELKITNHSAESMRNHFRRYLKNRIRHYKRMVETDNESLVNEFKALAPSFNNNCNNKQCITMEPPTQGLHVPDKVHNDNIIHNENRTTDEWEDTTDSYNILYQWLDMIYIKYGIPWNDSLQVLATANGNPHISCRIFSNLSFEIGTKQRSAEPCLYRTITTDYLNVFTAVLRVGEPINMTFIHQALREETML